MSKEYNIGIYIRLSMADEDTGYGSKAESDSIGNQRMLINRFLDNHHIFWMRSSASTTVPSRDFILPSGSSTIP